MSQHFEHYSMVIEWSDEDQVYIVTVPELPGCRTHGATYEEAVSTTLASLHQVVGARGLARAAARVGTGMQA